MASYKELYQIMAYQVEDARDLRNKVAISALITADKIASNNDQSAPFSQDAGKHDLRVKWAELAYQGLDSVFDQVFRAVVAANASATQNAILTANDATIQSNIDAVVDTLASVL